MDKARTSINTNIHNQENDNNNYYNTHTEPSVRIKREEGDMIVQAYIENISSAGISAAIASEIEQAYNHGLTAEEIILAIRETAFAPRPSGAYLRAILRNWVKNGVTLCSSSLETNYDIRGKNWWDTNKRNPF